MNARGKILDIRECSNCKSKVEIRNKHRLELKKVFCSHECYNEYLRNKRIEDVNYLNCECPICGKKFHLKPYNFKKNNNHYCSMECHRKAKKEYMLGERNHQYGLKGEKNSSWKSDRKITNYGYIKIRCLEHPFKDCDGFVFEHRLIAEKYFLTEENSIEINGKKYLKKEYSVHHINENKLDNRVENLKIMLKKEHCSIHSKERAKKYLKKVQKLDLENNILETYNSIKEASEKNNLLSQNISKCCKNKQKTSGGYKWKYLEK